MPQCIAALFAPAWALLQVLGSSCASPRGRHAARRHRSRRVHPYTPALPVAPAPSLPAHPKLRAPAPSPRRKPPAQARTPRPAKLAPPSTEPRAEDIALVRPYLTAHERDLAQQRATDRLRAWGAEPLPVASTTTPHPRPWPRTDDADTFPTPKPRIPAPRVPSRMEELPHLSRLRHRQQQRRAEVAV